MLVQLSDDEVKIVVRCGSVNKMLSSIVTDSWRYFNVDGRVLTAEVIMLRSNCVILQNKVQENYPFLFQ
jgi:N-acetylglutamate synthase/N-acetylornithine aminotransferase